MTHRRSCVSRLVHGYFAFVVGHLVIAAGTQAGPPWNPCDDNPDPCCGSSDPCCGNSDPCCGDSDPCCGSDDPCCGDSDPCCGSDDPCCGDEDPCCGVDCDDGDQCTSDSCEDGDCVYEYDAACCDVDCDDGNPCTTDICEDGNCRYEWKCEDDEDPCTIDYCQEGVCKSDPKCDDKNECTTDTCDPITGACTNEWPCDEPTDPCLERVCEGGNCVIRPKDCDDGNECTTDSCDGVTGACINEWPCEEPTDPCLERKCVDGNCIIETRDCDDGSECTQDYCDPESGCVNESLCDDENPCTEDLCIDGACAYQWFCDDENPCTNDSCSDGVCNYDPVDCNDNDYCTDDSCDPATGECVYVPRDCDDEDACTEDYCDHETGECIYTPIKCDDEDSCTDDSCNSQTGECEYTPVMCPECTEACTSGSCPPISVDILACLPSACQAVDAFICKGESIFLIAVVDPPNGTFSWQRTAGVAADIVGPTDRAYIEVTGLQPSFSLDDTEFEVTYTTPSGGTCKKNIPLTVGKTDGGVIVSVIRPVNEGPRPAGMVARLGYPAGSNPSNQQIAVDVGLNTPGGFGATIAGVISTILVVNGLIAPGTTFTGTPTFTMAAATPADREWITLLLLRYSPNPRPPTSLDPGFVIPTDEHRMVNELRFCYFAQNGQFVRYRTLVNRQIVGDTPFTIPMGASLVRVYVNPPGGGAPAAITVPTLVPISYTLRGNLITNTCTGLTGGLNQNFVRNAMTVRASPALATYEAFVLGFGAFDFFSRVKFNVEPGSDFITPQWIMGHSPTFRWPWHYVYRWQDNQGKYTPGFEFPATGTRGPFPGFISLGGPGDPPAGPQPSPWYPCTDP